MTQQKEGKKGMYLTVTSKSSDDFTFQATIASECFELVSSELSFKSAVETRMFKEYQTIAEDEKKNDYDDYCESNDEILKLARIVGKVIQKLIKTQNYKRYKSKKRMHLNSNMNFLIQLMFCIYQKIYLSKNIPILKMNKN